MKDRGMSRAIGETTWVALTSREVQAETYSEARDAISTGWVEWCRERNFLPLVLPNDGGCAVELLSRVSPSMVILTGGNDVMERAGRGGFSARRNQAERTVLDWVVDNHVPTLGICRGLHMINWYFGGDVTANLPTADQHVGTRHATCLFGDLDDLSDESIIETNSFHSQGILPNAVAPPLRVEAVCEGDGTVEALAHVGLPILGISWHPERVSPCTALDTALVQDLVGRKRWSAR